MIVQARWLLQSWVIYVKFWFREPIMHVIVSDYLHQPAPVSFCALQIQPIVHVIVSNSAPPNSFRC